MVSLGREPQETEKKRWTSPGGAKDSARMANPSRALPVADRFRSSGGIAVLTAVGNGLGKVGRRNLFLTREIGDRAGHTQDAVVCPRRQPEATARMLEEPAPI